MDKVIYRKAKLEDKEQIFEMAKALMKFRSTLHAYDQLADNYEELLEETIQRILLKNTKAQYFVADREGILVGYVLVEIVPPVNKLYKWKLEARIQDIFVKEEFRNKGLAPNLLVLAETFARKKKAEHMHVLLSPNNLSAEKLYKAFGMSDAEKYMVMKL